MQFLFIFYLFDIISSMSTSTIKGPPKILDYTEFNVPTSVVEKTPVQTRDNQVYSFVEFEDSRHKKILGWLLLGGIVGAAMAGGVAGGRRGGNNDEHDYDYYYDSDEDYGYKDTLTWIKKTTKTEYQETYTRYMVVDALTRIVSDDTTYYISASTIKSTNGVDSIKPMTITLGNTNNINWFYTIFIIIPLVVLCVM